MLFETEYLTEQDDYIVTVTKSEMFGEIKRICRELDIELKSPNRTLCKSLMAYVSASKGTPLRRTAGCSRSWVFTRDIYKLVYFYEGEFLERRDEEARAGGSNGEH